MIGKNRQKKEKSGGKKQNSTHKENPLAKVSMDELFKKLKTSSDGLSEDEAEERISEYGYNELDEESMNPVLKFLSYFWGPIPWMIEIAAVLSGLVKHWEDLAVILALLIVNAVVGFWEEHQAGNTIAALKENLAIKAKVKRGGEWENIEARELVPGDVIRLRIGDIVPADARFLEGDEMQVDQSALTGESLPVTKGSGDVAYSGSVIKQGEIDAVVYATGEDTYFGRTANLVQSGKSMSHFQKAILRIGDFLIVIALALVILILAVALFRGDQLVTTLQFALILTVAAIPVAMPTVLSVTMAIGARLLGKRKAIVSHLSSIQELAGMDILCSDKTGTITQNKLTLGDPFLSEGAEKKKLLESAVLASRKEDGDPIDHAVIEAADKPEGDYKIKHFTPFDPTHKRTEAEVESEEGSSFKVTKGAPQVILSLCSDKDSVEDAANKAVDDFAGRGFRSLGVARAEGDGEWKFLGILPLFDPPREDSKETIRTARDMGVGIKMITGDQVAIAKEVSRQVDLKPNILDAEALTESKHHEQSQIEETIEKSDGFAQVFPEHKHHIVDVLQRKGHIVGMTGDGVNDAPALQKADAGIAVSGSTDAARSAADIVLLSPGLSVIIEAIKESRRIFQRMTSYAIYRITETIRVLLFMTAPILVFNFYPVTAVMIVLLALLNDGAILSIAYDNVHYSRSPEKWHMPIVLGMASILGLIGVAESFGMFYLGEQVFHINRDMIQTIIYLKLSVAGHLTVFVARTKGPFWSQKPAPALLIAVLVTQVAATLISVYGLFMTPIGWKWAAMVWGYCLVWFFIEDRAKLAAYKLFDRIPIGFLSARQEKRDRAQKK